MVLWSKQTWAESVAAGLGQPPPGCNQSSQHVVFFWNRRGNIFSKASNFVACDSSRISGAEITEQEIRNSLKSEFKLVL